MYTPRRSAVWLRSLGGVLLPCEDQYRVSWGDQYSVLFQLFARGVTAMPRGLHDRLCHAFLVIIIIIIIIIIRPHRSNGLVATDRVT